jgi:hypothetical protein
MKIGRVMILKMLMLIHEMYWSIFKKGMCMTHQSNIDKGLSINLI